ncbi:MAG: cell division protein FtsA [Bacteroidales bacterium]|nr:cell division protein FtsA [Bacteroidales bacterium]
MEQEVKQSVDAAKMFAAIDVGTTKIVALVGYKNENNEIVVCGMSNIPSSGIWSGEVSHVSSAAKSIQQAVEEASKEAGFFPKKVVVGVAGRHVHAIRFSVPKTREDAAAEITQDELEQLKKDARNVAIGFDEEIINVVPQSYVLDGAEFVDPIGMACKHIDANYQVVVGKIQALMQLKQSVQMAGLELVEGGLYLEPLASADAVLTPEEKNLGVALIDIGGGTTDIAIFKDNVLKATAVIPFGGNLITLDIKKGCDILETDAEEIKKQYGEAIKAYASNAIISIEGVPGQAPKEISVGHLSGIIQSRVEEIIDSAMFEIGQAGFVRNLGAGVVVTGGGSKLKNMSQLLSFKIGVSSKISSPIRSVSYNDNTMFQDPMYSTSVGLLMKAATIFDAEYKQMLAKQAEESEKDKETENVQTEPETNETTDEPKHHLFGTLKNKMKNVVSGFFEVDSEY